ncbi:hypothetical protein BD289DRAFT_436144, partial [Coniella lustricola]
MSPTLPDQIFSVFFFYLRPFVRAAPLNCHLICTHWVLLHVKGGLQHVLGLCNLGCLDFPHSQGIKHHCASALGNSISSNRIRLII